MTKTLTLPELQREGDRLARTASNRDALDAVTLFGGAGSGLLALYLLQRQARAARARKATKKPKFASEPTSPTAGPAPKPKPEGVAGPFGLNSHADNLPQYANKLGPLLTALTLLGAGGYGGYRLTKSIQKRHDPQSEKRDWEMRQLQQEYDALLGQVSGKKASSDPEIVAAAEFIKEASFARAAKAYLALAIPAALASGAIAAPLAYGRAKKTDKDRMEAEALEEARRRWRVTRPPQIKVELAGSDEEEREADSLDSDHVNVVPLELPATRVSQAPPQPLLYGKLAAYASGAGGSPDRRRFPKAC